MEFWADKYNFKVLLPFFLLRLIISGHVGMQWKLQDHIITRSEILRKIFRETERTVITHFATIFGKNNPAKNRARIPKVRASSVSSRKDCADAAKMLGPV